MSSPKNETRDDGRLGKYFHALPNMADDDLDPYQYRLYGHYKRVCGVSEDGACWESTRTTATNTKMSVGKVAKSRRELETLNYIHIEERGANSLRITLLDVMPENITRYSQRSPHEQGVHHMNASVHDMKQRRTNQEEPLKKDSLASDDAVAPTVQKSKPRNPVFDAVALHIFSIDPNRVNGKGGRIGAIASWLEGKNAGMRNINVGYISKPVPAEQVVTFAAWYKHKTNDRTDMPQGFTTFVEWWRKWETAGKPAVPTSNGKSPLAGFKEYTGKDSA